MRQPPAVAIVVLNWNGWLDTVACLESLTGLIYPRYEILVVDNGSSDDSVERIRAWIASDRGRAQVTVIKTGANLGYAGGNNVGIRRALESGCDYVLALNNDTVVTPRFLTELVHFTEDRGRDVGIVGPKIYAQGSAGVLQSVGARIDFWKGKYPTIGSAEPDVGQYDDPREVDYVSGAALLARREMIERIGVMDERYFLYVEEVDWCYRARKAGYKVMVVPKSTIWHQSAASTVRLDVPLQVYYRFRNRLLFMRSHAAWYHWMVFAPYVVQHVAAKAIGYAVRARWEHLSAVLRALRDGLRAASPSVTT